MPGPKTHHISFRQLKGKLNLSTLDSFPNYDKYSLFSQGHDILIYHDYNKIRTQRKLDMNVHNSMLLQEWNFQEFIYNFLNAARNNGGIESEQVRMFLGPGYILHHMIDAYTHPLIIYYSGCHGRDPRAKTWEHGNAENYIDIYMMETQEEKDPKNYKVYRDFYFDTKNIDPLLIKTLNESLEETYSMQRYGDIILKSLPQIESYMRRLKYDKTGIKRVIFDWLDPKLVGTKSFSYHRESEEAKKFLNNEHEEWIHPMDSSIVSTESFMDLYEKALEDTAIIIDNLEKLILSGVFNKDDIFDIIPNIASTHGLECGQSCKVLNKKIW